MAERGSERVTTTETESRSAGPPKPTIAVLGDSLAQGLLNGAVLTPARSFPALVAEACGLSVGSTYEEFVVPSFFEPGIPINIDQLLRNAEHWNGSQLRSAYEMFGFLTYSAIEVVRNKHHYQRVSPPGSGHLGPPDHLAIAGLSVRDCIELTPEECNDRIADAASTVDTLLAASAPKPLLLIAKQVLNSTALPSRQTWSAVRCFERLVEVREPSVLIVHLGNADILGAVADLSIRMMPEHFNGDRGARSEYNVTHPRVFERDYMEFGERIDVILKKGREKATVLIGTLPPATIAPFIRGFGRQCSRGYFDAYGRFFVPKPPASRFAARTLSREEVIRLDLVVDDYNRTIRRVGERFGWHVVDVHRMVSDLAVKRRFMQHEPEQPLKEYVESLLDRDPDHTSIEALINLKPIPDTRLFRASPLGERTEGGLFGFDCGHPSALGYGLVADLFLRTMRGLGLAPAGADIQWDRIINDDARAVCHPPRLWREVLDNLEAHPSFFDFVFRSGGSKLKHQLTTKWREFLR